jgi:hypothetical protein
MSSSLSAAFAKRVQRIAKAARPVSLVDGKTKKARRGPEPLPRAERRDHTVSARFNDDELRQLDEQRKVGKLLRGEWLRTSWLGSGAAAQIPDLNRQAYVALARANGNFTQIRRHAGGIGDLVGRIAQVEKMVSAFRISLLQGSQCRITVQDDGRIAETASQGDRMSRRGPYRLPPGELRENVVCVRLNIEELDELDQQRLAGGGRKRGEWLRMAWQDVLPVTHVPELRERDWSALDRCNTNINQIARYLNEGGDIKGRHQIIEGGFAAFRSALVRAEEHKQ